MSNWLYNFKQRYSQQKSFYILVGIFLLLAAVTTYFIWIYAGILTKPQYSDLLPNKSISIEYDESGKPIGVFINGQSTSKKSKTITNNAPNTSSTTGSSTSSSSSSSGSDTPSGEEDAFSISVAFYGDSQSDTDEEDGYHSNVVSCILNSGANPVFHVGDLMEDGTEASLTRFNNVTDTLRSSRSFYAAPGNNDRKVGDSNTISPFWFSNFAFPNNEQWYSVNYGNLHLVVLDSAFSSGNASQLAWLESDLQSATSQQKITGVIYHHPSFGSSLHSILRDNGVDFVIAGHVHYYSKTLTDGIYYFTTSGQPGIGYLKASVYMNHVVIASYNNSCGSVDSVSFNER